MIPRTIARPNLLREAAAILVLIAIIFMVSACGSGSTVQRTDLYDNAIGLDYGYACDTLYIDDACTSLYGGSYYEKNKTKKRVKYKAVKSEYVMRNQAKIATYKTKAAENAKKARAAAQKAAASAKKSAASKPKVSISKPSSAKRSITKRRK